MKKLYHNIKYLSFDIECLPIDNSIPSPEKSPIVLISCCFNEKFMNNNTIVLVGKKNPFLSNFSSKNNDILWFDSEKEMIQYFYKIIIKYDPDIITGYNIKEFDIPYIIKRSEILNIPILFSRDGSTGHFSKYGITTKIEFSGRLIVDIFPLIKRDFNLKQYTLKNVSKELINQEKLDVSPKDMKSYWESNNDNLILFINYSRRDSELVLNLLLHLKLLDKYISLSQITNLVMQDIIDGGQTLMIEQVLLKEFKKNDRLMFMKPTEEIIKERSIKNIMLKGGEVLDPLKGLHENVIILDYKSLYPTIMMAYNLCYTTIVRNRELLNELGLSEKDIIKTSSGSIFVKKDIYQGIIPSILEYYLSQRVTIKKKMNTTKNKDEIHRLQSIEMAIKILLNSYYGYTGYIRSRLYDIEVANSVTSIGRINIENTKKMILEKNNYDLFKNKKISLEVIYGDTDSIFVRCDFNSKENISINNQLNILQNIGKKIANDITLNLPKPMELEFEAISKRILLITKKRYAHWIFENKNNIWKESIKVKGMETIRRDWCDLTSLSLRYVLEFILKDGDVNKAINYIYKVIQNLKNFNLNKNKKDIEKLIITKNYSKDITFYKNKQPHVTVVEKIQKRNGDIIPLGTRIPYVIIKGKGLFVDRAEDPSYIIEKNLPIDIDYYLNKQLLPPIKRILECFGLENIFDKDIYQKKLIENEKDYSIKKIKKSLNEKKIETILQKSIFDF